MYLMKIKLFLAGFLIIVFCAECKKDKVENNPPPAATDTVSRFDPVETKPANSTYKPAFEGQTRIYGIKTFTPLRTEVLNSTLQKPWGIAILPSGQLLITQKEGSIVVLNTAGVVEHTLTNLPAVNSGGQGGLMDITLDPDFSQNRMIYWAFSQSITGGNVTAVAKGKLANDASALTDVSVIYQALPAYNGLLHYGGRLLFDKDGFLLVSTGERSDLVTRPQAQELNSALGKVLRINKQGQAAPGNPFLNTAGALPEIYSYGHRNVQGMTMDKATNTLWESELGPLGGDEINLIQPGKNYGWPVITYGLEYSGSTIGAGITQKDGMEQPVYYWDPVISPSGMVFYDSDYIPEWKGSLLVTGLNGLHIARLRIVNNKVAGEERLLTGEGQRFRAIAQDNSGVVYAVTDGGRLYKISKQ